MSTLQVEVANPFDATNEDAQGPTIWASVDEVDGELEITRLWNDHGEIEDLVLDGSTGWDLSQAIFAAAREKARKG